jgi:hypothetical protein
MPDPKVSNGGQTVATKGTKHAAVASVPDVCRVPPSPTPQPLPSHVRSEKLGNGATQTVTISGSPIWTQITAKRW